MCKHWKGFAIKVKGDTLTNPFVIGLIDNLNLLIPVLRDFIDEITPVVNTLDMPNHNVIGPISGRL